MCKWAWTIGNSCVLGFVVLIFLLVDGNGEFLGFSEGVSGVMAVISFVCGIGLSTALLIADAQHRIRWVAYLIVYVVLCASYFIPAVLP